MNTYYYNEDELSSTITSLKTKIEEYQDTIDLISKLKTDIENSNEWVQTMVKGPFISKCDEYLNFYTALITKLTAHLNYLESKNNAMKSLESLYA